MSNEKKIAKRVEVLWDFDWILYHEYEDWTMYNVHCKQEFDEQRQVWQYTPLYQFLNWNLVAYSVYKAEWLTTEDDLSLPRNLLWWSKGKNGDQELTFRPLKNLEIDHLKEIIKWGYTNRKEYVEAILEILSSVITLKK